MRKKSFLATITQHCIYNKQFKKLRFSSIPSTRADVVNVETSGAFRDRGTTMNKAYSGKALLDNRLTQARYSYQCFFSFATIK